MSYGRSRRDDFPSDGTISGGLVAALLAGVTFGELLAVTGHLEAIPALYGLENAVNNWAFVVGHGVVAALPFLAGLTRAASHRYAPAPLAAAPHTPFLGACFGIAYGTVCWLVGVAYGLPVVVELAGGTLPMPYRHGPSLLALVGYGAVLGAWYPFLRTAIDDRRRS